MIIKKEQLACCLLLSILFFCTGSCYDFEIRAENNANGHNNRGTEYMQDGYYYAAIQEFKIAIAINNQSQASSVYYNNLGLAYLKISYPDLAQECFEKALKYNPMNFIYYENLVKSYHKQNIIDKKIQELSQETQSSLARLKIGLLYAQKGDIINAKKILVEFVSSEPDLIITNAVKKYLEQLNKSTI